MPGPFTGAKSNFLEQELLDHVLGGDAGFSQPSALWLSLFTGDGSEYPNEQGNSGNAAITTFEPVQIGGGTNPGDAGYGNYARVDVTLEYGLSVTGAPGQTVGATIKNTGVITFAVATEDWGSITRWGIYSAATATANLYYYGDFTTAKTVNSGDTVQINSGGMIIEER